MENNVFDAIRAVVNFARDDRRYAQLVMNTRARQKYFKEQFALIAAEYGVDEEDLRTQMIALYPNGEHEPSQSKYVPTLEDREIAARVSKGM